jgi:3-hydroxyacyl-CoA dehydrogenase
VKIKRACVIGMRTMGSQIGIVCAQAGFQTFMVDNSQVRVERGLASIRSFLEGRQKKGKMQ